MVWRFVETHYEEKHTTPTVKHPQVNGSGAMSTKSTADLHFLAPESTTNRSKYGDLSKEKCELFINEYKCTYFMHDKASL